MEYEIERSRSWQLGALLLNPAALCDVAEHENNAGDPPRLVANRGRAIIDWPLAAA